MAGECIFTVVCPNIWKLVKISGFNLIHEYIYFTQICSSIVIHKINHLLFYTTQAGGQRGRRLDVDFSHKVGKSRTALPCRSAQSFCPKYHYPAQRINLIIKALCREFWDVKSLQGHIKYMKNKIQLIKTNM